MSGIHIGHHFFGAGNVGDDFMLAGFLGATPEAWRGKITCAVPHPIEPLRRRFPTVRWLPYEEDSRRQAIESATAWLGLGGSPFQSAASRWFVDHLTDEARLCAAAGKPMFFLGIGGQDPAAYGLREVRGVLAQAERIWTRDERTAEAASAAGGGSRVSPAADLAHLFFAAKPPPPPKPGRLTVVLNFDYGNWPALPVVMRELNAFGAKEKVWAAQEARPLPGSEKWLWENMPSAMDAVRLTDGWRRWEVEGSRAEAAGARWPSGQWQLSSRYHATLAAAWAGSRAVVVATNDKLRGAAEETGFPLFELDRQPGDIRSLFETSAPTPAARLQARARLAAKACSEFFFSHIQGGARCPNALRASPTASAESKARDGSSALGATRSTLTKANSRLLLVGSSCGKRSSPARPGSLPPI